MEPKRKTSAKSKQALQNVKFLEDMRNLQSNVSTKSKLISIKIPENLLRAFKSECDRNNIKYQTQIKTLMWGWLKKG